MDNNNSEHPCIFQWNILNPFLPWEAMEATFYSGARTLIQWTVTIQPMGRDISNWIFLFSLRAEEFDEFDAIETHRVQIEISINERRVARERLQDYCFENRNHHTYNFLTHAGTRPTFQRPLLVVKVEIYLPAAPPPPINPMAVSWYEEDQMQLSEDLNRLLCNKFYSNMRLLPNDVNVDVDDDDDDDVYIPTYDVHSCIMDVRWNNFFRIHSFPNDNAQVEINIPHNLLSMILVYMYSGRFSCRYRFWPDWREEFVIAELFEVIDRYKLYHLYQVFAKSDSQQLRDTDKDLNFWSYDFELGVGNIGPYTLPVYYHNDVAFLFHIRVLRDIHQVRLSYFMEPIQNLGHRIYVQVNLQFVKKISRPGHRNLRRILSVHEQDYDVFPREVVQSGEVIFSLQETIFDDFVLGNRFVRSRRIDHFLRCIIYLSDGTSLMQVGNTLDNTVQNERKRFSVLGDYMHALLITLKESDLRIICRNGNDEQVYLAHKAIFTTRVPKYWRVLRNVRREGDIPDIVTCPFSIEAFRHILLYIYTGKILLYPFSPLYIDEVYRFAQQSEFNALINLVNRMRGR